MPTLRIIGPGRAGLSLAGALDNTSFHVVEILGRNDPVAAAAAGVDLVVIATPDAAIEATAAAIDPIGTTVVAHMSGAWGIDLLGSHPLRAAVHPLVALPDARTGTERLRAGAWFAVAGHEIVREMVTALHGHPFEVADENRAGYHASAVIASNHLVALLGQAERVSADAGVPFEAILDLVRATVANVASLGPAAALTGPAARGDEATIARHLAALQPEERDTYEAMAREARKLAGRDSSATRSEGRP